MAVRKISLLSQAVAKQGAATGQLAITFVSAQAIETAGRAGLRNAKF